MHVMRKPVMDECKETPEMEHNATTASEPRARVTSQGTPTACIHFHVVLIDTSTGYICRGRKEK